MGSTSEVHRGKMHAVWIRIRCDTGTGVPLSKPTHLAQPMCLAIVVLKRFLLLVWPALAASRTPPSPSQFVTGQAPPPAL